MQWVMNACPHTLGWQVWLVLCTSIVVLWAVAIAGAVALFRFSAPSAGSSGEDARREPTGRGRPGMG